MKDFCVILMFNALYLEKARVMIDQIREVGKYKGDVVCIVNDHLKNHLKGDNIIVKYFQEIDKSKIVHADRKHPTDEKRKKLVQICFPMAFKSIHYHKFYCFHQYLRENYKKCLYLDTGMHIFKPIDKIINLNCDDKILAHSDAYPTYRCKLSGQFDNVIFPELFDMVNKVYDLDIDYFQATMFLYDTGIIKDDTFAILVDLANVYINSKTNDQAVLNLYFNCLLKKWKQIKVKDDETCYYDFYKRFDLTENDYIMLKYPEA